MAKGVYICGGIGKHVAFTAVLPELKKKYGDIVLVSQYPEVFFENPFIYRSLPHSHAYLYEDFIKGNSFIKVEPYDQDEYRLGKKHITDVCAKILGLDSVTNRPQLFLKPEENRAIVDYVNNVIKKEYIIVQFFGGISYYDPNSIANKTVFSRDYPMHLAQQLVYEIAKKYPQYAIIQMRLVTEPKLDGVIAIEQQIPARTLFSWVKNCKTFISIDSCVQHISAAFDKKGIVLWGGTDPAKLGYDTNINMVRKDLTACPIGPCCHRPETYFFDQENGKVWSCRHDYECMRFGVTEILQNLEQILGKPQSIPASSPIQKL